MKFFYHVHGYEFQPYKDGILVDLLITGTNPKIVSYEMDIFWIVFPGQDPVKLFEKYGKRWELVHLKDMKKGTKTGLLTGGTDVKNDAALGAGLMDLPAILSAAKKAGVQWYFIEDESPWSDTRFRKALASCSRLSFDLRDAGSVDSWIGVTAPSNRGVPLHPIDPSPSVHNSITLRIH